MSLTRRGQDSFGGGDGEVPATKGQSTLLHGDPDGASRRMVTKFKILNCSSRVLEKDSLSKNITFFLLKIIFF